jgi:type VI secretion system protein ImpL
VVTRAGLDPLLLAGDAPALGPGDAAPPTAAANVWLAGGAGGAAAAGAAGGGAVLAEPGGAVFADAARWRAFVRALRAPGLAAAVGRGAPAPRAAVLCVSCDQFFAGSEQLDRLAQLARERLAEAARTLGVALPVYVLFTKADRVPQFEAWSAPFTRDEVRAPLGAALPFDAPRDAASAAGGYAERVTPRVERAFAAVAGALAGRRLELLGRESVDDRRLAAYEFPRELGKLAPAVARFLTEVCRPLHLGVAPQLRGFYFVGARPVVIGDALAGQGVAAAAAAAAPAVAAGATSAFIRPSAPTGGAAAPSVGGYAPPSTRRVPQWAFLDRLFPDVILADRGAAAAALGGVRVARLRRGLLGAAAAAGLVLAAMVGRSWANNRELAERARVAAAGVTGLPVVTAPAGSIAFPSADALRRLDALRAVLDTIRGYQADGVPTRLGMGLWQGDALADGARAVWLSGYRRQLHDAAWTALVDSLRTLPDVPRPADDYGRSYAGLKAYLINTAEPQRSTPEFLAPVLLTSWQRGQPVDADVAGLARRQFEFYARELKIAPPFPEAADAALVRRGREFLGRFAGAERIYQFMLAEASKAAPPAQLAALAPQAAGVLTAPGDVPGAFTARGWAFMQDAFRNADRFFQGERWVVGDAGAAQSGDRDRVLAELRARYRGDYVERWRAWVRGLAVVRAGSARDAGARLGTLGGAQSPLLAALSLAARNTAVDSGVAAAFQPVTWSPTRPRSTSS